MPTDGVIMILQALLVLLFAFAGMMKLAVPYPRFVRLPFQGWAADFQPTHVRLIGLGEVVVGVAMVAAGHGPTT